MVGTRKKYFRHQLRVGVINIADLNSLLWNIKRIEQHRVELTDERIRAIYEQLMKDLDSFIADSYKKWADKDGRLYLKYLDEYRMRAAFLQQIADSVDNIAPKLRDEILKVINATYEECYRGMIESLKATYTNAEIAELLKDIDVNPQVLQYTLNNHISKLTLPAVLEAHRAQLIYQIQQELTIGLLNGDRYETMIKRISERTGFSEGKSKNVVRTETHRNVEGGFMDCAEHLQKGLEGSGLIYAATWRTMKDERVRPQVRRKVKGKWKTTWSKNGANHMVMEGKTVKAGEMFNLGNGVKAKAPGQSGVAAHDCQCRCFLEYNLMTVEEFAKATGQTVEQVRKKYNL